MAQLLPYIQAVTSLLLIILILLQRSEAGLGTAFGSDSGSLGMYKRRGGERMIFQITIVLAILFAVTAFIGLLLAR